MSSVVSYSLMLYRCGGRVKLAEERRCRMCLTPRRRRGVRRLTRHHIVPQRWRGWRHFDYDRYLLRDADANIVPLCDRCHREVEHDEWARRMLRKVLGAAEVAFAIQMMGRAAFDEMYPPSAAQSRRIRRPRSSRRGAFARRR